MHQFSCQRRVEFSDTDMGGIVHFARFFVYMETTEHDFIRSLGSTVHREVDGKPIGWPRVAASCDYKAPARFGDVLDIHLRVVRKGVKSMTYGFDFRRGEVLIARGTLTAACCELDPETGMKAIPIPPVIADLLEEAPTPGD
jgi:YbgC/YbaW family acyl-CoA thioester hydrolase